MKKDDALKALNAQLQKLKDSDGDFDVHWHEHTLSYFIKIFGEGSIEEVRLRTFRPNIMHTGRAIIVARSGTNDKSPINPQLFIVLDNAINSVKAGAFIKEKSFFDRHSPQVTVPFAVLLVSGIATAAYYVGQNSANTDKNPQHEARTKTTSDTAFFPADKNSKKVSGQERQSNDTPKSNNR